MALSLDTFYGSILSLVLKYVATLISVAGGLYLIAWHRKRKARKSSIRQYDEQFWRSEGAVEWETVCTNEINRVSFRLFGVSDGSYGLISISSLPDGVRHTVIHLVLRRSYKPIIVTFETTKRVHQAPAVDPELQTKAEAETPSPSESQEPQQAADTAEQTENNATNLLAIENPTFAQSAEKTETDTESKSKSEPEPESTDPKASPLKLVCVKPHAQWTLSFNGKGKLHSGLLKPQSVELQIDLNWVRNSNPILLDANSKSDAWYHHWGTVNGSISVTTATGNKRVSVVDWPSMRERVISRSGLIESQLDGDSLIGAFEDGCACYLPSARFSYTVFSRYALLCCWQHRKSKPSASNEYTIEIKSGKAKFDIQCREAGFSDWLSRRVVAGHKNGKTRILGAAVTELVDTVLVDSKGKKVRGVASQDVNGYPDRFKNFLKR